MLYYLTDKHQLGTVTFVMGRDMYECLMGWLVEGRGWLEEKEREREREREREGGGGGGGGLSTCMHESTEHPIAPLTPCPPLPHPLPSPPTRECTL